MKLSLTKRGSALYRLAACNLSRNLHDCLIFGTILKVGNGIGETVGIVLPFSFSNPPRHELMHLKTSNNSCALLGGEGLKVDTFSILSQGGGITWLKTNHSFD